MNVAARRRPRRRLTLILLAVVVVLPLVAVGVAVFGIDARTYTPLILDRVRQATGRDIVIAGPITLAPSLRPTIALQEVTVANPPGFAAGPMLTVKRAEVEIALLPLLAHRVEIGRLLLVEPKLALETDAEGRGNWMSPPAPAAAPAPVAAAGPAAVGEATRVEIRRLAIEDGQLSWRSAAGGPPALLTIRRFDATATGPAAAITLAGTLDWRGSPIELNGDLGSIARLQDRAATTDWPVKLALVAGNAHASLTGALERPEAGRGYELRVEATVPQLADLASYLPVSALPNLHALSFAGTLVDAGEAGPRLRDLTLSAGAADLGAIRPGLVLAALHAATPAWDKPLQVTADLKAGELPIRADASLGAPLAWLAGSEVPVPVAANVDAAGSHLGAKGTLARPRAFAGADVAVDAHIADLAALAPLAGTSLPAIKDIAVAAQFADLGGFANGASLTRLTLTAPQADLSGEARLALGGRPSLSGTLTARRIDWDALARLLPKPTPLPPAPDATPAVQAAKSDRVIPGTPLPIARLKAADLDLRLRADLLHAGGADYHALVAYVVLKDGKLSIDPVAAETPGGALDAKLAIDSGQPEPPVALTLHAPGLALKPLLTGLGLPDDATGKLELDADLRGVGDTPRAIAATATGHLGAAMVDAQVDNRVILDLVGPLLHAAKLPEELALGAARGRSTVRCLALRIDATDGHATERAFVLDSDRLQLIGAGTINLADETLALKLRPEVKWSGTGVAVPLLIGGTLAKPGVHVDAAGAADPASPLAALAGALSGQKLPALGTADPCPAALALARGGKGGVEPAPAPARSQAPAAGSESGAKAPKPLDLLKSLLR